MAWGLQVCDLFGILMRKAILLVEACPCTSSTGCPGCVQHTTCNQYNAVLNKAAAVVVLKATIEAQDAFRQQMALRISKTAESVEEGVDIEAELVKSIGARLGG